MLSSQWSPRLWPGSGLLVVGLAVNSFGHLLVMLLGWNFAVAGLVAMVVPLVLAGLVVWGPRWLLIPIALVALIAVWGALRAGPSVARLTHPEEVWPFVASALQVIGLGVAAVAGVIASLQAYRQTGGTTAPSLPRSVSRAR